MIAIGNMLWRIGEILDFDEQLAWTRDAGFDGVGFHASGGAPGQWCGIEPADCDSVRRASLRRRLSGLSYVEIHAPFAIELTADRLDAEIEALAPVLELAADVDASVVTVHAQIGDTGGERDAWPAAMARLDRQAAQARTTIGLEITEGFDAVRDWGLPRVGVTLDVGHMRDSARAQSLERLGGLDGLIRTLGPALVHLHLHDTDGVTDHCEIGTGSVDFAGIIAALHETGYRGGATLEMNPDRCSAAGIARSLDRLRALAQEHGTVGR
jgi:sugar phosphate isomerase/epimerase